MNIQCAYRVCVTEVHIGYAKWICILNTHVRCESSIFISDMRIEYAHSTRTSIIVNVLRHACRMRRRISELYHNHHDTYKDMHVGYACEVYEGEPALHHPKRKHTKACRS